VVALEDVVPGGEVMIGMLVIDELVDGMD